MDVLLCDLASALLPAAEGQVDVLVSLFVVAFVLAEVAYGHARYPLMGCAACSTHWMDLLLNHA